MSWQPPGEPPPPTGPPGPPHRPADPYRPPPDPYGPPPDPYRTPAPYAPAGYAGRTVAPGPMRQPGPLPPSRGPRPGRLVAAAIAAAVLVGALGVTVARTVLDDGDPAAGLPQGGGAVREGCGIPAVAVPPPAPLTAVPPAGRPVVTPDSAATILDILWSFREAAVAACDARAIGRFETGFARTGDLVRTSCGCRIRTSPARYESPDLYVPRSTRFPAHFLAEVVTTGTGGEAWTEVLVVTRASATEHWRVAFDTGYTTTAPTGHGDAPAVDGDGYVRVPPAAGRAAARRELTALAAYWQHAKATGDLPSPGRFIPGHWTTERAELLAAHPSGTVQANGLVGDFAYRTRPEDPVYTFTTAGGNTLACGGVHRRATYRASDRGAPFQDRARRNWGADIAPSVYRQLSGDGVSQTCLRIPADGTRIGVYGGDETAETPMVGTR